MGDSEEASLGSGDVSANPPAHTLVRWGLLFYGAMAVVAVLWRVGAYSESILFVSPEAEAEGLHLGRDLAIGAAAAAGLLAASEAVTRFTAWGERLARALAEPMASFSVPEALLLAWASGLAEEMLFRGALQPRVGLFAASLLFGVVHIVPRREFLPWTGFAIAAGFLFGWLFQSTGALVAPVTAHILLNGINLPRLIRRYRPLPPDLVV